MTAQGTPLSFKDVLRIRAVKRLWMAQIVSVFGDFLALFAVIAEITFKYHGTPTQVGMVIVAFLIPLAIVSPLVGAAALMRRTALPNFAHVIGPEPMRVPDGLKLALGALLILLCVFAIQSALGLVFDSRYRDFPFAPMSAALVPFLVLSFAGPRRAGARGAAEVITAALLAGAAVYIALAESFANWQSLWLCAVFLGLAFTLWRLRDGQSSG